MATLIKSSGEVIKIAPVEEKFSSAELKVIIGGHIEVVNLSEGRCLVCDEEGLLKNLPQNREATKILYGEYRVPVQFLVGDIVICNLSEIK